MSTCRIRRTRPICSVRIALARAEGPSRRAFFRGGAPHRGSIEEEKEDALLWTILTILVVLWLFGLVAHVGGAAIHLLLVAAMILFVLQLVATRRAEV